MSRRVATYSFVCLIFQPAFAQFGNLRTNFDGSVLYFTTRLVKSGSGQPAHGKVFRIDEDGLAVEELREVQEQPGTSRTNYYDINGFDVSDDAGVKAIAARRDCNVIGCASLVNVTTTLRRYGAEAEYPGPAQLSENGRYLVNTGSGIPRLAGSIRQWDLATGESWALAWDWFASAPAGGRIVANDGTVVHIQNGDVQIQRRGEVRPLTFGSETVSYATIDTLGRFVVFVSRWPAPFSVHSRIRRADLATGELVTVIEECADFSQPSLSADGSVMTVLRRNQVYLVRTDGSEPRKLTSEDDEIQAATLSGDGRVAYAATYGGRFIRVNVESGEVTELAGRTISVSSVPGRTAQGSALKIQGTGLDEEGLAVSIGGLAAPIVRASAGELVVQTPWEAPIAGTLPVVLTLLPESKPVFEAPLTHEVSVMDRWPEAFGPPMHEAMNWETWQEDPARGGETVHILATGLGGVRAPVTTGVAQPAEPAPELSSPLTCYHGHSVPGPLADVIYAGLEVGRVGIYRVSVRMPFSTEVVTPGKLHLICTQPENPSGTWLSLSIDYRP